MCEPGGRIPSPRMPEKSMSAYKIIVKMSFVITIRRKRAILSRYLDFLLQWTNFLCLTLKLYFTTKINLKKIRKIICCNFSNIFVDRGKCPCPHFYLVKINILFLEMAT